MDILYLLIPMSVVLVLGILGVFAWALHAGQFDDLDRQAGELLRIDGAELDPHQGLPPPRVEESLPSHSLARDGGS